MSHVFSEEEHAAAAAKEAAAGALVVARGVLDVSVGVFAAEELLVGEIGGADKHLVALEAVALNETVEVVLLASEILDLLSAEVVDAEQTRAADVGEAVAQVAVGRLPHLNVFGNDYPTPDGTGVRDYIHVVDLAKGHLKAIEKLRDNPHLGLKTYNLGTGHGYSVLQIVKAFEKASKRKVPYEIRPRREGDIAECWADPSLALAELGWKAEMGIEEMCEDAWRWQRKNPYGYSKAPDKK